jgi:hypothetical protein
VVEVAVGRVRVRAVATALQPALVLATLVGVSATVRLILVFQRATPRYFPDEYLYSELAQSFARSGDLLVLDETSSLPSLLAPIVQSLAWLPGDAELAFRLTQTLHVLVMSLAVVPVYLVARRLGVRTGLALVAAAFAVACPDLVFAGYVTADAIGYTLALVAVHAALRALSAPSISNQAWFVGACAAAAATRVQYVVLLPAAAAASLAIGRRRPLGALRELWVVWLLVGLTAAAVAAAGAGALGRYGTLASAGVSTESLGWLPVSGYLLALAVGGAVVPGAASWVWCELARPNRRATAAFAALVVALLGALAVAAAVMSVHTGSDRFFERYLMVGVPLVGVAFACWLEAGRPGRRIALAAACLMVLAATQIPVAAHAEGQGRADSPLLLAVSWLERWVGVGTASLAVALIATVAALTGLIGPPRGRRWPAPALVVSLVLMTVLSAGAHAADVQLSQRVASLQAGSPPGWVDDAGVSDVLLVQTWQSGPGRAMTQAFWNASVTHGAALGDRTATMDGALARLAIDGRGRLSLNGLPVTAAMLVASDGSRALFEDAETVAHDARFSLVRPREAARLSALAEGLGDDGWLGRSARFLVYSPAQGCRRLDVDLALPEGVRPASVRIDDGARVRNMAVTSAHNASFTLLSRPDRPRIVQLTALGRQQRAQSDSLRLRSVRAELEVKPAACVSNR